MLRQLTAGQGCSSDGTAASANPLQQSLQQSLQHLLLQLLQQSRQQTLQPLSHEHHRYLYSAPISNIDSIKPINGPMTKEITKNKNIPNIREVLLNFADSVDTSGENFYTCLDYIDIIEKIYIIPFSIKIDLEDLKFVNKEMSKYSKNTMEAV